ncbi:hypothetical protein L1987_39674 [Smallanthus sonchifolius]|uniref:Uncharacterized protein n=1 Tax=Smallanthus sonchifolius TaxID=185202 RepID=A0ACB9HNC7_9ASTR|nr:hypothetical protein L1987_39674 [Smallanthus sonchifolius]
MSLRCTLRQPLQKAIRRTSSPNMRPESKIAASLIQGFDVAPSSGNEPDELTIPITSIGTAKGSKSKSPDGYQILPWPLHLACRRQKDSKPPCYGSPWSEPDRLYQMPTTGPGGWWPLRELRVVLDALYPPHNGGCQRPEATRKFSLDLGLGSMPKKKSKSKGER